MSTKNEDFAVFYVTAQTPCYCKPIARHCDNGASQISQRFARRPYATLSKIFDFVKVTEGAQQPKQSIIRWIASLRSQ
jgi:hypothetical protein